MEQKKKESAKVYKQREIALGIYDMWLDTTLASQAKPGQFISVYTQDKSALLPRPISICEADTINSRLRIVYRVAGKGTAEFSRYKTGHRVDILGTLGNGFPLEKAEGKRVFLMGGGIGIPPMLAMAKAVKNAASVDVIVGYRDKELFLIEDLKQYAPVHIATEDGSVGTKGNVMDVLKAEGLSADIIFACGPLPMLRAIKTYAAQNKIEAYISLEERMACGIGACLGCVCKSREKDSHTNVNNKRICKEGPVFRAEEVEFE